MREACPACPKLIRCDGCPQVTIDEAIATVNIEVEDADHPVDIETHEARCRAACEEWPYCACNGRLH